MSRMGLILVCVFGLACTDEVGARRILKGQGYRNIQTTGYSVYGCGEDDRITTGFTATGVDGSEVTGTVCCGVMKNCTVRVQ